MEDAFRRHLIANKLYVDLKFKNLRNEYIEINLNIIISSVILTKRLIRYQTISDNIMFKIMDSNIAKQRINKISFLELMMQNQILSELFINQFSIFMSNDKLIETQELSISYIQTIINQENVRSIIINQNLDDRFIEDNLDMMDMTLVSEHQSVSEEFIYKHKKDLNLQLIGCARLYSSDFILKNLNTHCAKCLFTDNPEYLSIENIVKYQNLDKYSLKCIFYILEMYALDEIISERILLLIESISWRQHIDSDLIKQFINIWKYNNSALEELFIYQNLSEDVILMLAKMKLISKSGWMYISKNQKITSEIFKLYKNNLYKCNNSKRQLSMNTNARTVCLKKRKLDNSIVSKIHSYL